MDAGGTLNHQQGKTPDLTKLRSILFWDTVMEKIDWNRQQQAVIRRVFERGNETERQEILDFYGIEAVVKATGNALTATDRLPVMPHLKLRKL